MNRSAIFSTLILLGKDHCQPSPHTLFSSFQTETVNPLNSSFLPATLPSLFLCTWLIYIPHTSGPTQHLSFGDWYSNHNAPAFHTCGRIPFLPKPRRSFSFCRSSILLVHLSTDGHGLLLPLGITDNSAAVSHTGVWDHRPASALTSVWYMLGSGTARSEGNSRFRNHGIFHSGCPIMHLDQQLPEACHFSTSFLTLGKLWFCLFDNSHPKVYQVTSHCTSGLHFPHP